MDFQSNEFLAFGMRLVGFRKEFEQQRLTTDCRAVVVRANDCLPCGQRLLDLSEAAVEQLKLMNIGIARVTVISLKLVDQPPKSCRSLLHCSIPDSF